MRLRGEDGGEEAPQADLKEWDAKIEAIGGRTMYQQASQLSTSFHSTSKWVLGYLQRNGWLYGIPIHNKEYDDDKAENAKQQKKTSKTTTIISDNNDKKKKKRRRPRRDTKILEIGAINTELLDASERTVVMSDTGNETKKYRLQVRAIDLHSMYPGRIEEADFNKLPLPDSNVNSVDDRYDVIVCSMVLNCVTTPQDRGEILTRIYDFLLPGGKFFFTVPKLCLTQSPFIDKNSFMGLLGPTGVGFKVDETKESPKVCFFICSRPPTSDQNVEHNILFDDKWIQKRQLHFGKKYRNQFAVVLDKQRILATRQQKT